MALLGPFSVGYPVAFKSNGDTTKDAFGKHIQEINKIYGILNAIDADKISASDLATTISNISSGANTALQNHIDSTSPHPNWKPSLSFSDLSGTLDGSKISGTIPASKVSGQLTNATIEASKVLNLPTSGGSGYGITDLGGKYAKFGNGLIIQWGEHLVTRGAWEEDKAYSTSFPISFPNACLIVVAGTHMDMGDSEGETLNCMVQTKDATKTGFKFVIQQFYKLSTQDWSSITCNYIAIGN